MRAKFINEARYGMQRMDVDPELQREYGIPDWAIMWNGIDLPESGVYVDDRLYPGEITTTFQGEPVVVIYKDEEEGTIATKAHNVSDYESEDTFTE